MAVSQGLSVVKHVTTLGTLSGSYVTGDVVGAVTEVTDVANSTGGVVILESIIALNKDTAAGTEIDIVFFDEAPVTTIGADSAAFALADSDLSKVVGIVTVPTTDVVAGADSSIQILKAIGLMMKCKAKTRSLFIAVIARGTEASWTDGDLQLKLGFFQEG